VSAKKKSTTPRESGAVPEDTSGTFEDFIARTEQRARKVIADAAQPGGQPEDDSVLRAQSILREIQITRKCIRVGNADDAAFWGMNLGLSLYEADIQPSLDEMARFRRGRQLGAEASTTRTYRTLIEKYPNEDSGAIWNRVKELTGWWEEDGYLRHGEYAIARGSFRSTIHRLRKQHKT
jgi:hypothetical protein